MIRIETDYNTRIISKQKIIGNDKTEKTYYPQIYVRRWYLLFLGWGWKDIPTDSFWNGQGISYSYGTTSLDNANDVLAEEVLTRQDTTVRVESERVLS